jgi:hypothetical protein
MESNRVKNVLRHHLVRVQYARFAAGCPSSKPPEAITPEILVWPSGALGAVNGARTPGREH